MAVILEIKAGPFAGQKISVVTGQTVTLGRAEGRAEFALPHDTFMSGVHFAVECTAQGCRVQDRKSSNGTFLNGARTKDAMLANGDEIKGGQTVFAVKIVADAKLADLAEAQKGQEPPTAREVVLAPPAVAPAARPAEEARSASVRPEPVRPAEVKPASQVPVASQAPAVEPRAAVPAAAVPKPGVPADARGAGKAAAFSVMGWSFSAIPEKWEVQQEFGLQRNSGSEFPSSVAASEEVLGGISLQQFVESQISMLRGYLREPKIEPTMPPRVANAEETLAVDVRHSTKDGKELVYRRIYARSGPSVGVLTVTTLAGDLPQVLQSLQPLLDGAAFRSTLKK
ncbi:MAG: FHA domain-containing protein [Candidatus Acidiferrum sp.]